MANIVDKKKLKYLFSHLNCSDCGADFVESSFEILNCEDNFWVVNMKCANCAKNFGIVFVGCDFDESDGTNLVPFDIEATPKIITTDEVLDAHHFIKTLDVDWKKYIPNDFIIK